MARASATRSWLRLIGTLTRRTVVVLPMEAGGWPRLLEARAPYRRETARVPIVVRPPRSGSLAVRIMEHVPQGDARVLLDFGRVAIADGSPIHLDVDLDAGTLRYGSEVVARHPVPAPRRFATDLRFESGAVVAERRLGHYIGTAIADEHYFTGGHYRDYESQAPGDIERTITSLRDWRAEGPVLEIGCATGVLLAALAAERFPVGGIDVSSWAVARARERVGEECVWCADIERDGLPPDVLVRSWRTVVMSAVLEHLSDPAAVLQALRSCTSSGALLFLSTCNAASLTHVLFGPDWEGFADPTHKSAHLITPDALRRWLRDAGWDVESMHTHSIWDDNPDQTHAALRGMAGHDARFRQLLVESDRGDFLDCVARRV